VLTATRQVEGAGVDGAGGSGDLRDRYRGLVVAGQARGVDAARAYCVFGLVRILNRQDRNELAGQFARRALDWLRGMGDQAGAALALNQLGRLYLVLGDPDRAGKTCQQALELCRELADPLGEACAAEGLGLAQLRLGGHTRAARWCEHAATLYARLGEPDSQMEALIHLGDALVAMGQTEAARQSWQRASTLVTDPEHPGAALLRARLGEELRDS
jgi:tetratricopeptide (TPR) repeat protein